MDINENWQILPSSADLDTLIYSAWGDSQHTHTMLHWMGQHVGAGVAVRDDSVIYVLDVAAFWGDAGLTVQPTSDAYPGLASGDASGASISQYMAPVQVAEPDEAGRIIHTVLQGQTLWSIATAYDVTIDQITSLNGLSSESMIYAGQELLIQIVPTPSMVPSVTMGTYSEAQGGITTAIVSETISPRQVKSNMEGEMDDWVLIGIIVIALLGFSLVFLGQKKA